MPTRRLLLLAPALAALGMPPAAAQRNDPRMAPRAFGRPEAKLVVQEWYSLTCTHCAHFSETAFPEIQVKLIDTGHIRYVFQDYPLDQVALTAAAVARMLPEDRYLPFVESLLASQDRWAFDRSVDPIAALSRQAALAGMSAGAFQSVLDDKELHEAIMAVQDGGQKRYDIQGTPTFVFGEVKIGPISSYADFAAAVDKATSVEHA